MAVATEFHLLWSLECRILSVTHCSTKNTDDVQNLSVTSEVDQVCDFLCFLHLLIYTSRAQTFRHCARIERLRVTFQTLRIPSDVRTLLSRISEQILTASRGNGFFVSLMKGAVGLAIGTDGIEVTLLSYLVPCVAAEWDLSSLQQGSLTASVFAGELVRGEIFVTFGHCFQVSATTRAYPYHSSTDLVVWTTYCIPGTSYEKKSTERDRLEVLVYKRRPRQDEDVEIVQ